MRLVKKWCLDVLKQLEQSTLRFRWGVSGKGTSSSLASMSSILLVAWRSLRSTRPVLPWGAQDNVQRGRVNEDICGAHVAVAAAHDLLETS